MITLRTFLCYCIGYCLLSLVLIKKLLLYFNENLPKWSLIYIECAFCYYHYLKNKVSEFNCLIKIIFPTCEILTTKMYQCTKQRLKTLNIFLKSLASEIRIIDFDVFFHCHFCFEKYCFIAFFGFTLCFWQLYDRCKRFSIFCLKNALCNS